MCIHAVLLQSCLTLCNPRDCSPPDSSVRGISQARTLEWVAIPFSRGSSWPGIEPGTLALQADFLPSEPPGKPGSFFFFPFIFISWRLITLQYCSGFCHTLTWISHGFTCVPHPDHPSHFPPHPIPLSLPSEAWFLNPVTDVLIRRVSVEAHDYEDRHWSKTSTSQGVLSITGNQWKLERGKGL